MGTKNNPGAFDCYANAQPDEPMFVLLGRDRMAGALTRQWAIARAEHGERAAVVGEALACADKMDEYCRGVGKEPINLMAPYDMPSNTRSLVFSVDPEQTPPQLIGRKLFGAVVLPVFGPLSHTLDTSANIALWAGFLAAVFGAMAANLTVEGASAVIDTVRDLAIIEGTKLEAAAAGQQALDGLH